MRCGDLDDSVPTPRPPFDRISLVGPQEGAVSSRHSSVIGGERGRSRCKQQRQSEFSISRSFSLSLSLSLSLSPPVYGEASPRFASDALVRDAVVHVDNLRSLLQRRPEINTTRAQHKIKLHVVVEREITPPVKKGAKCCAHHCPSRLQTSSSQPSRLP